MTGTVPATAEAPPQVRPGATVAALAFGGIVVALLQTLVIPLIPELPGLLHASASDTTWTVTATLLAAAVATPTVGRLGDMYGKRRMLLFSLGMVIIGSVLCGLSGNLPMMVVGRALQGLSTGVIPLGISLMRDELPPARLGSAVALMSASLGVGAALGLPAAALIADKADWHVLFWGTAGLAAIAMALVIMIVPESKLRSGGRFDLLGALGMSAALLCLLLAISKGGDWGWGSGTTLGLFAAAVAVLLLWGVWELRTPQPLVDLRITARRQVLLTNLASVVYGFAMFAMWLVIPQLLELPTATGYGLGQSILMVGLVLAPNGLLMMATAPVSAAISRAMGPKVTLMLGAFVVAVGYALTTVMMGAVWQVLVASCVIGVGIGLGYGAMPSLIMGAVPMSETAAANSLNTLMRSIGTSLSSALGGVILVNMTMSFGPLNVPTQDGFRVVLYISGAAALVAVTIAAFLPGRRPATAPVVAGQVHVPAAGQITGVLRSAAGAALAHGIVTVTGADGRQVSRARAGGDGSYTVTGLEPGHYTVIVTAAGFEAAAAVVSLNGSGAVHDVALSGGGAVSGSVRLAGGEPVAGAAVTATGVAGDVVGSTVSAADGTFRLTGIPAGPTTFVAQVDNHPPQAATVLVDGREPTVVDLVVETIGRLHGAVTAEDGRPLAHAAIAVTGSDGVLVATCTADEDGNYEVPGLAPGRYTVVTSLYTPTAREISLTGGGRVTVDLDLTARS